MDLRAVLERIVMAYDIRGLVDGQLEPDVARAIGAAAADVLVAGGGRFVVGRDMRPSSPELLEAFAEGVLGRGVDVIDIGLASTDGLYYASGVLDAAGAMFTASHNPADYNGIKLCGPGAAPVSIDSGLGEIRDRAIEQLPPVSVKGTRSAVDLTEQYAAHVRSFVDPTMLEGVRVAVDAGNGMAGHVWPAIVEGLEIETTPLFFELDGTFPNHPANPLEPANLVDLQLAVLDGTHDLGLAFDGDADRVFAIDERGIAVSASVVGAIVAERMLERHPGSTILHNLICSRTVAETVKSLGGMPIRTRVGHSFIKRRMTETGAVMALEHSGHYYFRDNFRADSGSIAALLLLEAVGRAGAPLSAVAGPYDRYPSSGEINFRVPDVGDVLARVEEAFEDHGRIDTEDGLTVTVDGGWFNLRPSNTEPLLRLNVEGDDIDALEQLVARVSVLVTEEG